jgi:UDP-2,3-diacylglucosamine pyrophosphatase LpxH
MEIALITDTHAGVRNDSVAFHDKSKLFYDNVFFPYLKSHDIKMVCHLGDVVDRRKYVNFNTAARLRADFLEPLAEMGIDVAFIAGNHDTFFKASNELNSLQELIAARYEKFIIADNFAFEIYVDEGPILLIPWICDQNRKNIFEKIKHTRAQIAFGHLELKGFEMNKGIVSTNGDDPELFSKFDVVCTGHYHHRSSKGNIHYLGSHAQFTWADYGDERGFHIFDTVTRKLRFVVNPYTMFHKLIYNDTVPHDFGGVEFKKPQVPPNLDGCMIKIIVDEKENPYEFDAYIEEVEKQSPTSIQIIDDHRKLDSEFELVDRTQDTLSICLSYVDEIDFIRDNEKEKLKLLMADLYTNSTVI